MDSPLISMEMEGWDDDSIASFGMAIALLSSGSAAFSMVPDP